MLLIIIVLMVRVCGDCRVSVAVTFSCKSGEFHPAASTSWVIDQPRLASRPLASVSASSPCQLRVNSFHERNSGRKTALALLLNCLVLIPFGL
jgi:hypothetical protein